MASSSASAQTAVRHLLLRTTYGLTPDLVKTVTPAKRSAWLAAQLKPAGIKDPVCDAFLRRLPRLGRSIPTTRASLANFGAWDVMYDLCYAAIARAAWSQRQLLEVLVDMWSNHLNITCPSSEVWDNRHRFDADVIRKYALGKYTDMLYAAITHPAMLAYLNNADSTKDNPNENLGRELLELHTVGVNGGYTELDVKHSALLLTGLSIRQNWETSATAQRGLFVYRTDTHYVGPLRVLKFQHANASADGRVALKAYLNYLALHPATAQRIARRIAVRFVSDDPPKTLVDRLARIYLAGGSAITPMLTNLFASKEFAASVDAKVRTPQESLLATVRALGLTPPTSGTTPIQELYWGFASVGQQPLAWPQPDGYPDVAAEWQSAADTVGRWNMNSSLVGNWWPKGFRRPALSTFTPNPLPATHSELINAMAVKLRQRPVTVVERDAICGFLGVKPTTRVTKTSEAVTWRREQVLSLLLDGPTQAWR